MEEVTHTPKLVTRKKRIDPIILVAPVFTRELSFLSMVPIRAITRKLPYTNGIVAWNPRNRSEIRSATIGIMKPLLSGIIAPEKSARAAMGATLGE